MRNPEKVSFPMNMDLTDLTSFYSNIAKFDSSFFRGNLHT